MRRIVALIGSTLIAAAASTTAAQAANLVNLRAELPFEQHNPCTGEDVIGDIRLHYLLNLTINGNNVSGMELLQYSAHGVGQTTGASYTGSEVGYAPFKASLLNGEATMSDSVTFHLTTPGAGNNWVIRATSHITINANGAVTVSYDNLSSSCE
jgi:hypothetical protein